MVTKTNFLGAIIDSKLTWKEHIDHVAKKVKKNIGVLAKARKFLNKKTMCSLYYTFIYPYLTYCNSVWAIAANSYLTKLHILPKNMWSSTKTPYQRFLLRYAYS